MRLVVEEGGNRRAFRMGEGILTVGSGAQARLHLSSADVAEIHAELELREGSVRLRPRPGVVPPAVDGIPATGEVPLALGQAVTIGSARLWLQTDEGPIEEPSPPSRSRGAAVASHSSLPGVPDAGEKAIRREAAIRAAAGRKPRSLVRRRKRPAKGGVPGWGISLIVLGAVAGGAMFVARGFQASGESMGKDALRATIDVAGELVRAGSFADAEKRLDLIPAGTELSPAQKAQIASLRAEIETRRDQSQRDLHDMVGHRYFDVYLERFERNYLQGSPDPPRVRLFLKRAGEFRRRWPGHMRLDWVDRQVRRFEGFVDLSQPPTYADVAFEIETLVDTAPREYRDAFRLVDELVARSSGSEKRDAEALRERLADERAAYHKDRIALARSEYESGDVAKSVWWLVHSAIQLGDADMENEAARILVKIPKIDEHLRGYRDRYPEKFAALMKNETVAGFVDEKGL